jgi:hypothetical protein
MNALSAPHTPLVRRGAQGGSSEMLSREEQKRIDTTFRRALEAMGSGLGSEAGWESVCGPVRPQSGPAAAERASAH